MANTSECKVLDMQGKPFEVIDGKKVKLRADGKPKRTKCNAKEGGSTWVDPIRNKDDIGKIIVHLQAKIDNTDRADYRKAYARNKLYFCIGVFSGFRVSDLIGARKGTKYKKKDSNGNIYYEYPKWTGLKWQDVYYKDGKTFRKEVAIKELKTGHMRKVQITEIMKKYFTEYIDRFQPDTTTNDYIFTNRQKEKMSSVAIDQFIKECVNICGIDGNYSTHSLRKTYVYHKYLNYKETIGEEMALAKTMKYTGHRNMSDLLRYLGLKDKETEKDAQMMDDYWGGIF